MKKILIAIIICLPVMVSSQMKKDISPSSETYFSIGNGINQNISTGIESRSTGGQWDISIAHYLANSNLGFSTSLGMHFMNIGSVEGVSSSEDAIHFRLFEVPFEVIYRPLEGFPLSLQAGFSYVNITDVEQGANLEKFDFLKMNLSTNYRIYRSDHFLVIGGARFGYLRLDEGLFKDIFFAGLFCKVGLIH